MAMSVSEDEWRIHDLDLPAYLRRISYAGALDPGVDSLAAIHRAHVAAIPFENFDVILGRGVSVALTDIQNKLVQARRGGYCYEHGLLFAAVLQRLGFAVDRLLARVGADLVHPRPRTHLALFVTLGSTRWLADVGFGSGLLEPIPLIPDAPVTQGAWTYRVVRSNGTWLLQERSNTDPMWSTRYAVAEETHHFSDVVMSNHYTSTWPRSPFVAQPVLVRKDEQQVRQLLGRELSLSRPGAEPVRRQLSDEEFHAAVRDLGLELEPAEIRALVATLPPSQALAPAPTTAQPEEQ
jgi:N-hydroxyarylamine O-acetyltransferase